VDTLIPAHGIYAGRARVEEMASVHTFPAAIHIGPNATFGETLARVEAHLLGFEGSLLGRTLVLELIEFLRPTRRFDSVGELTAQITADVARARQVLRG
jgi:riboflavin kinase/FMN adenylyltransferase